MWLSKVKCFDISNFDINGKYRNWGRIRSKFVGDFDTHVILYKKWIISCDFRASELAQYAAGQVLWAIRPTFISSAVSSCLLDLSSGIPETLPLFTNEDRRPPFSSLDFLLLFILVFLGRCFREVGNENVKLVIYGYNFSSFSGRAGSFLRSPFLSIPALSRALEWLSPLALILCSRAEIVLCPGWSWGGHQEVTGNLMTFPRFLRERNIFWTQVWK